jgi:hypothetical protein
MNFKKFLPFIIFIFFLLVVGVFLAGQGTFSRKISDSEIKYVKIAGAMVKVDLALTPEAQEQGLSGRISLASDAGMLFIFPKPSINYFWMKDMNFPIDIIWLDENLKVIYIKKDANPELFPESYGPNIFSKYVLEVSAGFSEKNNLKTGDGVQFLR